MTTIHNKYELEQELNSAGQCRWGFVRDVGNGHMFFVKQFLAPKYTADTDKLDPGIIAARRKIAQAFFDEQAAFYNKLKRCRNGCNVVNLDFFRDGTFYYAVSDKVSGHLLNIPEIAQLEEEKKRTLLRTILTGMAALEKEGIVHSDIKPDNILVKETINGYCAAKIIDFDSGYLEDRQPKSIVGDQPYFSPEKILAEEENVRVTTRSDIFALGILFHEYWTGEKPSFDTEKYAVAGEAVLDQAAVGLSDALPRDIAQMLAEMLQLEAEKRPSAAELLDRLTVNRRTVSDNTPEPGFYAPSDEDL